MRKKTQIERTGHLHLKLLDERKVRDPTRWHDIRLYGHRTKQQPKNANKTFTRHENVYGPTKGGKFKRRLS